MSKRPINVQTPVKKGESIDKAIKRFSRKVKKEGIIDAYREKMYYEKPSDKKKASRETTRENFTKVKTKGRNYLISGSLKEV